MRKRTMQSQRVSATLGTTSAVQGNQRPKPEFDMMRVRNEYWANKSIQSKRGLNNLFSSPPFPKNPGPPPARTPSTRRTVGRNQASVESYRVLPKTEESYLTPPRKGKQGGDRGRYEELRERLRPQGGGSSSIWRQNIQDGTTGLQKQHSKLNELIRRGAMDVNLSEQSDEEMDPNRNFSSMVSNTPSVTQTPPPPTPIRKRFENQFRRNGPEIWTNGDLTPINFSVEKCLLSAYGDWKPGRHQYYAQLLDREHEDQIKRDRKFKPTKRAYQERHEYKQRAAWLHSLISEGVDWGSYDRGIEEFQTVFVDPDSEQAQQRFDRAKINIDLFLYRRCAHQ